MTTETIPQPQTPPTPPAGNASDPDKSDAFGRKMIDSLNGAAFMLMASVGHRTGLFDAMATMPPSTGAAIAAEAGLSERYVREWLGAMLTAGVVEHDPAAGTYRLPREHAAWLTRAATPNNLAATAQWFAVLGGVEDEVVEAFGHGRGVPYSSYRRFHEVMAEETQQTIIPGLIRQALPLAPGLPLRLGQGIDVLDVGCGAGGALAEMASTYRRSRFTGYDFSDEAIAAARVAAERRGLRNLRFESRDVAGPLGEAAYDLVTAFDAIHDQAKPAQVLKNIRNALRPGGVFFMVDIAASSHHHHNVGHPVGTFVYTVSCMHCMSVSLAHGGPGLGAAWGKEKALEMLADAGFANVRVERLDHDILNYYYVATVGREKE